MSRNPAKQATPGQMKEVLPRLALELMESEGEAGFSLRKLGQRAGCDPMTALYHFGSKEGLYRAMADVMERELNDVAQDRPWRDRLTELALQYRQLALRYPHSFWLLQKFVHTGVADLRQTEMVHRALAEAGVADAVSAELCLGWYAAVLGLVSGEINGLVRAMTAEETDEITQLDPEAYSSLHALIPRYRKLEASNVFTMTLSALLDGLSKA